MKKMTILLMILSFNTMAFAVEMDPALTEDPKKVEALAKQKEEKKQPIEVKREELKKKHAVKKKAVPAEAPKKSAAASTDDSKIKIEQNEIKALNREDQIQEKKDDKSPLGK